MGLDIRVYGNIKLSDNEDNVNFKAYVIDDRWKHKIKNLVDGADYIGDIVFEGVSYGYSSHNRFREMLVNLIGRKDLLDEKGSIKWNDLPQHIPFHDFIDFADNEGCIDWATSNKIFKDFYLYQDKAKKELSDYDYENYRIWLNTFYNARNKGVVVFS